MNYASIMGVTIAIAVIAVLGIALLSYLSSLVKSAYQIKVEMRADLDSGLKSLEDEMRKKSRWMRTEVGEDVAKMKQAMEQEIQQRLSGIQEDLQAALRQIDEAGRAEAADLRAVLAQTRKQIAALDQDVHALKDEAARRAAIGRPPAAQHPTPRKPAEDPAAEPARETPPKVPKEAAPSDAPGRDSGAADGQRVSLPEFTDAPAPGDPVG